MSTTRPLRARATVLAVAATLVLAACGGDDDTAPAATSADTDGGSTEPAGDTTAPGTDAPVETDLGEGPVQFRAVNLLDVPVDVWVRTTGFVEAKLVQEGLAPGEVSVTVAPPADGEFALLEAGAGDATCVGTCPHILLQLSATETYGPAHTVVLYLDEGQVANLDMWEEPTSAGDGFSNQMPLPDASSALVVVNAAAVDGADFGLRAALAGVSGCLLPEQEGILIGGTQTPTFRIDTVADLVLHDSTDQECTDAPLTGTFTVGNGAGSRTHLILWGDIGAMEGMVLPFLSDDGLEAPEMPDAPSDDREAQALQVVIDGLMGDLGFPEADATCAAPYVVEAMGVDTFFDGDTLVSLDELPDEAAALAADGLVTAVDACGIDPNLLGG